MILFQFQGTETTEESPYQEGDPKHRMSFGAQQYDRCLCTTNLSPFLR